MIHLLPRINIHWHIIQSVFITLGFNLGVIYSMGLDNCLMMCFHSYNIVENTYTTLKILFALPIHSLLPNWSCCSPADLVVAIVLPFLECHVNGITQNAVLRRWFFSLSMLRFIHWPPSLTWDNEAVSWVFQGLWLALLLTGNSMDTTLEIPLIVRASP